VFPNPRKLEDRSLRLTYYCKDRIRLLLQTYIREAEGLLAVVLYLKLILLIEPDLAYRRQAGAFAILIHIQHNLEAFFLIETKENDGCVSQSK
jgi:hypothetical protein